MGYSTCRRHIELHCTYQHVFSLGCHFGNCSHAPMIWLPKLVKWAHSWQWSIAWLQHSGSVFDSTDNMVWYVVHLSHNKCWSAGNGSSVEMVVQWQWKYSVVTLQPAVTSRINSKTANFEF
jgi:hypothetical protein